MILNHQPFYVLQVTLFPCGKCEETFKHKKDVEEHRKSCKNVNLDCTHCGQKFPDYPSFMDHQKVHYSFVCNLCGKQCAKEIQLDRHMLKLHNHVQEGVDACMSCKVTFR